MATERNQLIRPEFLTDRVVNEIRKELGSGRKGMSDMLRSERELAERYKVGRRTVRRALQRLVDDGYLVSRPRQGYALTAGPAGDAPAASPAAGRPAAASELLAYVHGARTAPWLWNEFDRHLEEECLRAPGAAGSELLFVGLGEDEPENLARRLAARGVRGAVVNADNPDVAAALRAAGIPVVRLDAADAGSDTDCLTQDNFGGAYLATMRLVERGHRRIAWVGRQTAAGPQFMHYRERLGGYLAALGCAGLSAPEEWRLSAPPAGSPGQVLADLAARPEGPTAAVAMWHQVLPDLGRALAASGAKVDLAVWWGALPDARETWKRDFPGLPVPGGVVWSAAWLARRALRRLAELAAGDEPGGRILAPVEWVPGEASNGGNNGNANGNGGGR